MINLSQAHAQWQELAADIPKDDVPALVASWNNYTDTLTKNGELCALQYQYCPAYDEDMPGEGGQYDSLRDDREFILAKMGVSLSAVFVPFSKSRNQDEPNPSLNWLMTLHKNGANILTTDYMQGSGYCPAHANPTTFSNGRRDNYETNRRIRLECETGNITRLGGGTTKKKIAPPTARDVMHCLLLDSAVLDCGGFSEWCADYGYSDDSISARRLYDTCIDTALKLRGAFGEKTMSELSELFEGM